MSDRTQVDKSQDKASATEAKGKDRRRFARSTVVWPGRLFYDGTEMDCIVLNISANGAKVQIPQPYRGSDELVLEIPRFGEFPGAVAWREENAIGITFHGDPKEIYSLIGEAVPGTRLTS